MALRIGQLNFKARDAAALGRFWAAALDWEIFSERPGATAVGPAGFTWPDPVVVSLDFIAVTDPPAVADRVHLDLGTTSLAHQAALVERLESLGAVPADVGQRDVPWTVLADPEGNVFCVLEPREVYQDTGPIAAIVVDCASPRVLASFWQSATGWTVREVNDDYAGLRSPGGGPWLEFLRTSDPRVRNHIHLDLVPSPGQEAEVARLRTLGASDADVGQGDVPWRVLTDPEGNQFCVLGPHVLGPH
ncbi:VOC family protein [Actinoplanes sp. NPDC051861]|uniref:VOC family protein n=1 Tax=Actinoplanes sp. NPDC051861 TaxID=3155170 RepID=UPI003429275C